MLNNIHWIGFFFVFFIECEWYIKLNLAKRLSEEQKEELIQCFTEGKSIGKLSEKFNFTKLTISRNLKKYLGEEKYIYLVNKSKFSKKSFENNDKGDSLVINNKFDDEVINTNDSNNVRDIEESFHLTTFVEISPLDQEIDNTIQKDLSSVHISDIKFPNIVYMIVDNKIELNIKFLKDYPDWQFLPQIDLDRKTIEIYFDLKIAKRFCKKDQKVIKIPNTDVFKITAAILTSRGISRIVSDNKLISL